VSATKPPIYLVLVERKDKIMGKAITMYVAVYRGPDEVLADQVVERETKIGRKVVKTRILRDGQVPS
jgi:hypothetical protein